jgi:DNA-binding transcriptional LysR family regulator
VSAAARRLGVTQSAASQSLAKLRRHFGDDLLQRQGQGYELTTLAAGLRGRVDGIVRDLGQVLSAASDFEARDNEREYVVLASDYVAAILGGPLTARLAVESPSARLSFRALPEGGAANLQELFPMVDGLAIPQGMQPPGEHIPLFSDSWCCVVDEGLAKAAASWSVEQFMARKWVATEVRETLPARDYLRHSGIDINVAVRAQTFTAVPYLVSGTPHIGVLHRRLAERLAHSSGTAIIEPPWPQPSVHMVMFYDVLKAQDPAVKWFLEQVATVATSLQAPPPATNATQPA